MKYSWVFIFILSGVLVLTFQNCGGGLAPKSDVVISQSIYDIDGEAISRLLNSPDYIYNNTNGVVSLNKTPSLAESSTAVFVFERSMTGMIYRYYANPNVDEARVSVPSAGVLRILHVSDANNYAYADVPMPDVAAGSTVTVAANFGIGANSMSLLVNGIKQNLTLQKVGSPYDFSYVQKSVSLEGTGGKVLDVMTYSSVLSNLDANVLSRYLANKLQITNVAFDSSLINDTGTGSDVSADTPEFLAAKAIIDANCTACHNGSNNGDFRNLTQSQFLSKGLVVAKNPGASKIYYRLVGAQAGMGPMNMPQGGALATTDVAKIAAWINSIN